MLVSKSVIPLKKVGAGDAALLLVSFISNTDILPVLKSDKVWAPVDSDIRSPDLKSMALAFPSPVPEANIQPVTTVSK